MKCNKCGAELCVNEKICQKCGFSSDGGKNNTPEYIPICTPSYKSSYIPGSMPEEAYVPLNQPTVETSKKRTGIVIGTLSVAFILAGAVLIALWIMREKASLLMGISGIICLLSGVILLCVVAIIKRQKKCGELVPNNDVLYATFPKSYEDVKVLSEASTDKEYCPEDGMKTDGAFFKTRIAPEIKNSEDVFATRVAPDIAQTSFENSEDKSTRTTLDALEENNITVITEKETLPVEKEDIASGEWFSSASDL